VRAAEPRALQEYEGEGGDDDPSAATGGGGGDDEGAGDDDKFGIDGEVRAPPGEEEGGALASTTVGHELGVDDPKWGGGPLVSRAIGLDILLQSLRELSIVVVVVALYIESVKQHCCDLLLGFCAAA
jgi:hypothetical protein